MQQLHRVHAACRTVVLSVLVCAGASGAAHAQNQLWVGQYGSPHWDESAAAAADGAGGVFAGGTTGDSFGGSHAGGTDAWIGRIDAAGNQSWVRQLGTLDQDYTTAVTSDGAGGVYAAGHTTGDLAAPNVGISDAWLARYDGAGNQLWIRQFVIDSLNPAFHSEFATSVAPDGAGGVFVSGWTQSQLGGQGPGLNDLFIARYDAAGHPLWVKVFGSAAGDTLRAAAPDGTGGVFVAGSSTGSLGALNAGLGDIWVARYDGAGNQDWIVQFGTAEWNSASGLCPDGAGGLFVAGTTQGDLAGPSAGTTDAWLARLGPIGNVKWVRQLGTYTLDEAAFCATDGSGGCFVGGHTLGSLGGPHQGSVNDEDAWMARYDREGVPLWVKQIATDTQDFAFGAASDAAGGAYLFGHTGGVLAGATTGEPNDVFVVRYGVECQSGTQYCTSLTTSGGCTPTMDSEGVPSFGAPGSFVVRAENVENGMLGLVFFGTTGAASAPFLGGTLCVASPVYRLPAQPSGGAAACTGQYWNTLSDLLAHSSGGGLLAPAVEVHCQAWFRDPPAAFGVGLTNGLRFTICN